MILVDLFFSFLKVGLFSFGGGMASLPLIQSEVVTTHQWISLTTFTDLITIAEMTPGPIAINAATFVGIQIAGGVGAVVATLGCIMPSCLIVSLLAWIYFKFQNLDIIQGILNGLRPAIVALIASAGVSILMLSIFGEHQKKMSINVISLCLFMSAFLFLRLKKPNPILVIFLCGCMGGVLYLI